MVVAESYLVGIPFGALGLAMMVAFKPIADFLALLQREWAGVFEKLAPRRIRAVMSIWLRVGTEDDTPSKGYRYGIVLMVGASFFLAGAAAVIGLWNPYE
jgi:hypothetical protein